MDSIRKFLDIFVNEIKNFRLQNLLYLLRVSPRAMIKFFIFLILGAIIGLIFLFPYERVVKNYLSYALDTTNGAVKIEYSDIRSNIFSTSFDDVNIILNNQVSLDVGDIKIKYGFFKGVRLEDGSKNLFISYKNRILTSGSLLDLYSLVNPNSLESYNITGVAEVKIDYDMKNLILNATISMRGVKYPLEQLGILLDIEQGNLALNVVQNEGTLSLSTSGSQEIIFDGIVILNQDNLPASTIIGDGEITISGFKQSFKYNDLAKNILNSVNSFGF